MEFVPALAVLFLVKKIIDTLRYATSRDVNGVTTQLITWVAGVASVLLAAQTAWANGIEVGGMSLHQLNTWSQVFVGLTVASGASVVTDTLKAVDNHTNAKIPPLLEDPAGLPPRHGVRTPSKPDA